MIFGIIVGILILLVLGYSVVAGVIAWFIAKLVFFVAIGIIFAIGVMLVSGDPTMMWAALGLTAVIVVLAGLLHRQYEPEDGGKDKRRL
ncbi:MAG: hypothetical protein IPJ08_14655 [Burkholderiales bacterium]|nr:hypothetical protein [Burkholderiales bacterium]